MSKGCRPVGDLAVGRYGAIGEANWLEGGRPLSAARTPARSDGSSAVRRSTIVRWTPEAEFGRV